MITLHELTESVVQMGIKNTKTEENLHKALAGESMARNKYTFFAEAARKSGQDDIAAAFEQMAKNEMMHAKFWFEQLYGKPNDVESCLKIAAQGEYDEWHDMYPSFAQQAREDGLEDLAVMFEKVASIERSHENRFMSLLLELSKGSGKAPAVAKQKKSGYRCQFCGALFDSRPDVCNVCHAIGAFDSVDYFE